MSINALDDISTHSNRTQAPEAITSKISVIRRNGAITPFDADRIIKAITSAFCDVEGQSVRDSLSMQQIAQNLTNQVIAAVTRKTNAQTMLRINVEDVQDQVELALMRNEYHKVARSYVLYREEHRKIRETRQHVLPVDQSVVLPDGSLIHLEHLQLSEVIAEACEGLEDVDPNAIFKETKKNIYNGALLQEVQAALIMSARIFIETEPNYKYVAARLLLRDIFTEVLTFLKIDADHTRTIMVQSYGSAFKAGILQGIALGLMDSRLSSFNLDLMARALKPERDLQFDYLGLQTLYDRYFIHHELKRFELPQAFFMRVAMGLAILEPEQDKEKHAIEFYNLLSSFDYMSSTPTLFNAGTPRPQLSSCYLTTIPDDLNGIYNAMRDNALLSKFAGGLGNDWTPVRALNAHIKGTNGKSQGVVPFMKVANDTAVAVNQGGKRKGAVCAYLETWHLDIEEFLELRKNTGDDRRRTHDMNTANWIPDLFMKRVVEQQNWTLFSPEEAVELHDLYGDAFENKYLEYEKKVQEGQIRNFKSMPAINLWRKMLSMLFETGHPWITFKDPCNLRSPQSHIGIIHSSNLCTEITLNTSEDEIAVCNLGSVNLAQHIRTDLETKVSQLDTVKLQKTVQTAIRMLDNVIDINLYPVIQARRSNLKHRPIGLGIMGFQDALYKLGIPYASEQAVEFADRSMEQLSYAAIEASMRLAKERGPYASFEGSLWSKGILPIDSINRLQENRGIYLDQDRTQTLDWQALRQQVRQHGVRNSNVLAIAPTATISNICGVSQSIEPTYQNLYVKSNLSGEFTLFNPYLVADLKALGLWNTKMVKDLKYYGGSLRSIHQIPDRLREKYATAFEIDPIWLIEAASRRQKWIDQAQSLNLYINAPSGKKLDAIYRSAWLKGLKTTYYLRSLGATDIEKSTVQDGALNAVKLADQSREEALACSIENPDCEACQ